MKNASTAWNDEYNRQGIPSSHRDEPSSVVTWALSNVPYISQNPAEAAVDLGCGTGRNAIALAHHGFSRISAMDFSPVALELAKKRDGAQKVNFLQGSVTETLPFENDSFDLATDVFVYFHQLSDEERRSYRNEIHRVLKPGGVLLVSMATAGDGYYGSCDVGPLTDVDSTVTLAWDPVAEVGNILPTYAELLEEFSDLFELQMSWIKRKNGIMHGKKYLRETVGTLWCARS